MRGYYIAMMDEGMNFVHEDSESGALGFPDSPHQATLYTSKRRASRVMDMLRKSIPTVIFEMHTCSVTNNRVLIGDNK